MTLRENSRKVRAGVSVVRHPNGEVDLELWPADQAPGGDPERVERFTAQQWVDMFTLASKVGRDPVPENVELVRIEIARMHDGRE